VSLVRCGTNQAIIVEFSFSDGLILKRQVFINSEPIKFLQKEVVNRKKSMTGDRFVNLRRKPFQQEMAQYFFKWGISIEGRSK